MHVPERGRDSLSGLSGRDDAARRLSASMPDQLILERLHMSFLPRLAAAAVATCLSACSGLPAATSAAPRHYLLVHFTGNIPQAGCAWAPEAIYDEKSGFYLVYWATISPADGVD